MSLELITYYYCLLSDDEEEEESVQLSPEDRRRRDRRTPRIALRKYSQSAFRYMFGSGDDQALLNCCGVDHKVFRDMLSFFEPVFNKYMFNDRTGEIRVRQRTRTGLPKGRQREIDSV